MSPSPPTLRLESVERLHLVLVGGVFGLAWLVPALEPWSIAAGGAVMAGNVWLTKTALGRAVRPGGSWRRALAWILLLAKFGLLLGLVGLLFWRAPIDGMSFALGITLFLVAAVVAALRAGAPAQGES